jgi:hypothetical protein
MRAPLSLKRGNDLLGTLIPYASDFPWIFCTFEPTELFAEVKPLFDEEAKIDPENEEAIASWDAAWGRIEALGLRLVPEDGSEEVTEMLLHIDGTEASFRY